MNRNLLIFSILLIAIGVVSGYYYVSVLGFFLLLPSLISSTRRQGPVPIPKRGAPPPRRILPPARTTELIAPPEPAKPTATLVPATPPTPTVNYSPPLFPTVIFPSFNPPTSSVQPQQVAPPQQQQPGQRDELLEIGAIVAIVKLALG